MLRDVSLPRFCPYPCGALNDGRRAECVYLHEQGQLHVGGPRPPMTQQQARARYGPRLACLAPYTAHGPGPGVRALI